jgi:hypothetical protein
MKLVLKDIQMVMLQHMQYVTHSLPHPISEISEATLEHHARNMPVQVERSYCKRQRALCMLPDTQFHMSQCKSLAIAQRLVHVELRQSRRSLQPSVAPMLHFLQQQLMDLALQVKEKASLPLHLR